MDNKAVKFNSQTFSPSTFSIFGRATTNVAAQSTQMNQTQESPDKGGEAAVSCIGGLIGAILSKIPF